MAPKRRNLTEEQKRECARLYGTDRGSGTIWTVKRLQDLFHVGQDQIEEGLAEQGISTVTVSRATVADRRAEVRWDRVMGSLHVDYSGWKQDEVMG